MEEKIIIAGFGGQGVLFIGRLLAYAALKAGIKVTWIPSYGPEMRGGTANCSVILSQEEIGSPIVEEADIVIAMNRPSIEKFMIRAKKGGVLLTNGNIASGINVSDDVALTEVPAPEKAEELGNLNHANLVLLGYSLRYIKSLTFSDIEAGMQEMLKGKKEALIIGNMRAIQVGVEL